MGLKPGSPTPDGMPKRPGPPSIEGLDTSVTVGPLRLASPILTASGCFGSGKEMHRFVDLAALGAVVCKTVTIKPRLGITTPRGAETPAGMLNAIGLQNPGVHAFVQNDLAWLAERGYPAIASVGGHSLEDYVACAEALVGSGAVAVELNLSCPNLEDRGFMFALDPDRTREVLAAVTGVLQVPVFAKLSPDVTDLAAIAGAALEGGATGLSLINTTLGMAIDPWTARPKLSTGTGGLSGPAIRPIAVRCVYQVAKAHPGVPIIGMGGIATGSDAAEFLLAGASAVAVGTVNFVDPHATARVGQELAELCRARGLSRIADLTGAVKDA
ncbi:MAG: dihydroorotate dehydrogenase [Actinomycetota bacterium]